MSISNNNIETLVGIFTDSFTDVCKDTAGREKKSIMAYINIFFRKWYYSPIIDNTELSPALMAGAANIAENMLYPVVSFGKDKINMAVYKYSAESHPFVADYRIIAERVLDIVRLDEDFNISDKFLYEVRDKISIPDKQYIEYIFMAGIKADVFEKMPSVGVTAIKPGKRAEEAAGMSDRDILLLFVNAAIALAADNLSENFLDEYYRVKYEDVEGWLKNPTAVDEIFKECYGEIFAEDAIENFIMGNSDELDRIISLNSFGRGVRLDKWFLTPFGYYFRLIEPVYLSEFSFYDEIKFFASAYRNYKSSGIREILESAIYSPCTAYRITKLGADIFGKEYTPERIDIFNEIPPEDIINIISKADMSEFKKCFFRALQDYDVATLRLSDFSTDKLWLDIDIAVDRDLDYLHLYISYLFGRDVLFCDSFKFYKIPASPFTEYTPSYMNENGPRTDKTTVAELLNEDEECFYEAVFSDRDNEYSVNARLTCKKISPCKKGYDYPRVSKLCKRLKEEQFK